MHNAWFMLSANNGSSGPTNIPYVFPNTFTTDPESLRLIVNPTTGLFTIVDNNTGAAYPAGKTVKFRVAPYTQKIDPVLNTSAFNTYTGPFTLFSIIGKTAEYNPVVIISVKVFDPINGDSGQIDPQFQTRASPQG